MKQPWIVLDNIVEFRRMTEENHEKPVRIVCVPAWI